MRVGCNIYLRRLVGLLFCPNHLRMGRVNTRALDGPMRLPKNKEEHLRVVRLMYDAWFAIWRDTYVPHLLHQPKWFNSDKDLLPGDLVYFLKQESKLAGKWIIGMVEEVEHGKDGVVREVKIKYCNASEQKLSLTGDSSKDKTYPRTTIRTVRKVVKLFSIEDAHLGEDIREFQEKMKHMPDAFKEELDLRANCLRVVPAKCSLTKSKLATHCCVAHCQVPNHHNAQHDHT